MYILNFFFPLLISNIKLFGSVLQFLEDNYHGAESKNVYQLADFITNFGVWYFNIEFSQSYL